MSLCLTQTNIGELAVEAASKGSCELALQAMLVDPVVNNMDVAEKVFNELLRAHASFLPQFKI